jgi:hypothetical protein
LPEMSSISPDASSEGARDAAAFSSKF